MADQQTPYDSVGTVAEEAAKLVEALGGLAQSVASQSGHGSTPSPDGFTAEGYADEPGSPASAGSQPGSSSSAGSQPGGRHTESPGGAASAAPQVGSRCEHCGAANGTGQAVACQLCPVCQGIALLRAVRPETVDRLADLAGALSSALREVAADRRGSRGAPTSGQRVQDINVDDDDLHDVPDVNDGPAGPGRDGGDETTQGSGAP